MVAASDNDSNNVNMEMSACGPWYDGLWMMLVALSCHDAGEHFLPWWWWGKTASLQSALSLPHKIDVGQMLQKQSASADNLWLTSWLGKTMSFKRRWFLASWISFLDKQYTTKKIRRKRYLTIFSSLLDKGFVQTKDLSWEIPISCRFWCTTGDICRW